MHIISIIAAKENMEINAKQFSYIVFIFVGIPREQSSQAILQALRDETLNDPRERIEIAQSHVFYRPSLLGQPLTSLPMQEKVI